MSAYIKRVFFNRIIFCLAISITVVFYLSSCKTSMKKTKGVDLVAVAEKTKPERAISETESAIVPSESIDNTIVSETGNLGDFVLARVDGEPITNEEVLNAAKAKVGIVKWEALTKTEKEKVFAGAFQGMVARKLILAEAKSEGYSISDDRILAFVRSQIPEINQKFGGNVARYTEANKLNYDKFIKTVKDDMIYDVYLRNNILPKDNVPPEEIRAYYEQNQSQYFQEAQANLYAITLYKKGDPDENAKVLEKANEILSKIKEGQDFAQLAKEFTEDATKRDKGGDWGWVSKDSFAASELNKIVFNLKSGEHSEIIETSVAYWIVKIVGTKSESTRELGEVWKEIESAIKKERSNQALSTALDKLQKKHKIIIHNIPGPKS